MIQTTFLKCISVILFLSQLRMAGIANRIVVDQQCKTGSELGIHRNPCSVLSVDVVCAGEDLSLDRLDRAVVGEVKKAIREWDSLF